MLACVHIILIYNSRGDGPNGCFLHASPFSKAFSRKKSSSIAIYLYPRNTNNFFSINPFSRKVSSSEIFAFDEEDPLFFWDKERGKLVYILVSIYLYPRNTNNFFSINPFSRKVSSSEIFPFDEEDPLFYWNKERKKEEGEGEEWVHRG